MPERWLVVVRFFGLAPLLAGGRLHDNWMIVPNSQVHCDDRFGKQRFRVDDRPCVFAYHRHAMSELDLEEPLSSASGWTIWYTNAVQWPLFQ